MFGDQVRRLAQRVSETRFAAFPVRVIYRNQPIQGSSTAIKTNRKLREAGFTFSHDGVVRIPLAAASSISELIGQQITIISLLPGMPATGQVVRIAEVVSHPNNPEWKLGVTAL